MAINGKKLVLFLCTHNSARSQMAEGLLNALKGDKYVGFSAGIKATKIKEFAINTMKEIGIDISNHRSKTIEEFKDFPEFDYVITVCNYTKEICTYYPKAKKIIHKSFPDPITLEDFKYVRNNIKKWIEDFF